MTRPGKTARPRRTRALAAGLLALSLPVWGVAAAAPASSAPEPEETAVPAAPDRTTAYLSEAVAEARRLDATAQHRTRSTAPEPAGPDVIENLEQEMAAVVADGALGITARVEAPGLTWASAAGRRELDGAAPAAVHDRFRVASNTKTMVATLAMQEIERGTWTLDTTVEEVLPGILPADLARRVTVEQMLSHRSGAPSLHVQAMIADRMADPESLADYLDAIELRYPIDDHLATINTLPWDFEPGTDGWYSNAGYVLVGLMLEEQNGRALGDLLEKRVFAPAGMRHADYPTEPGVHGPFLVGATYGGPEAGWESMDRWDPEMFHAAGAASASTRDLNRLNEALFTGDLVSPETVTDMVTPRGWVETGASRIEYGLGVYRVPDPCVPGEYLYGHDGGAMGTISVNLASLDGERQVTMAVNTRDVSGNVEDPLYDPTAFWAAALQATC